jgi:hypothetical protein
VLPIALLLLFIVLLCGVLFAVWRYWDNLTRLSPEEEEYDERVAAMNERQANRLSDDQIRTPVTDDEAWNIMVRRGQREPRRRSRYSRSDERRPAARRDRYGGDLARRADERRERSNDAARRIEERRRSREQRD